MGLPTQAVTLSVEQIRHLNQQLTNMRHDINNHLSMMVAITELRRVVRSPASCRRPGSGAGRRALQDTGCHEHSGPVPTWRGVVMELE